MKLATLILKYIGLKDIGFKRVGTWLWARMRRLGDWIRSSIAERFRNGRDQSDGDQ